MHMEATVIHIEVHRVSMDTMDMDMVMVRGLLMLDMVTVMDMELLLSMSPRLTMDMDTTLPITTMVSVSTRGLLMLSQDMAMATLSVILIEVHRDSMDTMVDMDMDMDIMDMAKGLLSQDIMVILALLSTKAVLTTMDPMDMVSSIMARDPLMLDIMDTMDMAVLVTSKLTDHTLTMGSVLLILTKCGVRWRLCNSCNVKCQDIDITQ